MGQCPENQRKDCIYLFIWHLWRTDLGFSFIHPFPSEVVTPLDAAPSLWPFRWGLCAWHSPVPALIPLFQTSWHLGRPLLFSKMWLNLANRLRTALGRDAHKKSTTPAAAETFPFTTSADFFFAEHPDSTQKNLFCQWILNLFPAHYTCLARGCFLSFPLFPAGTCTLGRVNC